MAKLSPSILLLALIYAAVALRVGGTPPLFHGHARAKNKTIRYTRFCLSQHRDT